jgi:aldose 1-epimerase
MAPPSGHQHVLVGPGDQQAVVVEVGGGLREYSVAGRPILDGYGESEACDSGRGQILAPWANRLRDGVFDWEGTTLQLPLTEVEHHNAIHGLVRWGDWSTSEAATDSVRLVHRLRPQPGWPWPLEFGVRYSLGGDGLRVELEVTNPGSASAPFGAGFHPYLAAFGGTVDDLELCAPGSLRYLSDDRGLPVGTEPVAGGPFDFREGRRIGDARIDVAFTDLKRDPDGLARVELRRMAPERGQGGESLVQLSVDAAWTHLMIFTGDTVSQVGRRRRGLAVEPMTSPPDMLRSGDGRKVLAPGERWRGSWGITPGSLLSG